LTEALRGVFTFVDLPSLSLGGIFGVLLGTLLGHRLALNRSKQDRLASACTKFRNAVLEALRGLYPQPLNWPSNPMTIREVLHDRFPALQHAVKEFSAHLPPKRRLELDSAWRKYRLGPEGRDIDIEDYWQYIPHAGTGVVDGIQISHDNRSEYLNTFKRNVDALLSFADGQ
jgi:hypothetical protein